MTGYYLAAIFGRHAEMRRYRDELETTWPEQVKVTSRWIDLHDGSEEEAAGGREVTADPSRDWRYALTNIEDIVNADVFVLFTGDGPSLRGGRHVEFGRAQHSYDMYGAPRLVIVGPPENVYHGDPMIEVYPDWPAFLAAEKKQYLLPGETRASRTAILGAHPSGALILDVD